MINTERIERIGTALDEACLDGLVVNLPTSVLLLSGYWPVTGTSLAVAARDGRIMVLLPEDEEELADTVWAEVHPFAPGGLGSIATQAEGLREPLFKSIRELGLERGRVGYESPAQSEPVSHTALYTLGAYLPALLGDCAPDATLAMADEVMVRLRAVQTPFEIDRVRRACERAEEAYRMGESRLESGRMETDAAADFRPPLIAAGADGIHRAGGFVHVMAGPRSAMATTAFLISRSVEIPLHGFALVQVNSYIDGAFTDITRTYWMGEAGDAQRALYEAVFAAREAALAAIRPGARAADVDRAARDTLADRGFGDLYTTPTGHGVGFAVNDKDARPRLHPKSPDVLEAGMVFNVEPGLYKPGEFGLRHCDMVAVTETGHEVLTSFQSRLEDLVVRHDQRA